MKKGLLKKILGVGAAVAMMAGSLLSVAAEPTATVKTAQVMGIEYYKGLESAENVTLTGQPSLQIKKYIHQAEKPDVPDTSKPIEGVQFKYAKVGDLYQLTLEDGTSVMSYGVTQAFAAAVGITGQADYLKTENGTTVYFFNDGDVIANATRDKTDEELKAFLVDDAFSNKVRTDTTPANGVITAALDTANPYGLYLVVEYDVSNAKVDGDSISITRKQVPFIVTLPTVNGGFWDETVEANVKNSTGSAEVEKKIVVGKDEALTDGTETVADTDITSIGDTVHFRLKGTILSIPSDGESIEKYILTDQISKGMSPVLDADEKVKIDAVRIEGDDTIKTLEAEDYTVSTLSPITDNGVFKDGNSFTITIEESGRNKLTQVAKNGEKDAKEIYFYYSATVGEDAVIGKNDAQSSGNPNQVKLDYKVTGSADMSTEWDKVTEFTFGIDLEKQLEGGAVSASNKDDIQFRVYSGTTDKTYYTFAKNSDGVYTKPAVAESMEKATLLSPDASGHIQIKGLEEGTYFVEEVQTVDGYNLLTSPVEFVITANTGTNTFIQPSQDQDQYLGTLENDNDDDGYMEATVINTKGFQLPATGGAGIWMFVLGGAAVILAGCAYFVVTRKNNTTK